MAGIEGPPLAVAAENLEPSVASRFILAAALLSVRLRIMQLAETAQVVDLVGAAVTTGDDMIHPLCRPIAPLDRAPAARQPHCLVT